MVSAMMQPPAVQCPSDSKLHWGLQLLFRHPMWQRVPEDHGWIGCQRTLPVLAMITFDAHEALHDTHIHTCSMRNNLREC